LFLVVLVLLLSLKVNFICIGLGCFIDTVVFILKGLVSQIFFPDTPRWFKIFVISSFKARIVILLFAREGQLKKKRISMMKPTPPAFPPPHYNAEKNSGYRDFNIEICSIAWEIPVSK